MTSLAPGGQSPENLAMQRTYDRYRQIQPINPFAQGVGPPTRPPQAPFAVGPGGFAPSQQRSQMGPMGGGYRGPSSYTSIGRGGIDFSNFPGAMRGRF